MLIICLLIISFNWLEHRCLKIVKIGHLRPPQIKSNFFWHFLRITMNIFMLIFFNFFCLEYILYYCYIILLRALVHRAAKIVSFVFIISRLPLKILHLLTEIVLIIHKFMLLSIFFNIFHNCPMLKFLTLNFQPSHCDFFTNWFRFSKNNYLIWISLMPSET